MLRRVLNHSAVIRSSSCSVQPSILTHRVAAHRVGTRSASSSSAATLVGALDQGTSSTRFLLYDTSSMQVVAAHQLPVTRITPHSGWVQMNPLEILSTARECMHHVMSQPRRELGGATFDRSAIAGIGITNQRETTVVWNGRTGEPLYDAIVWLDLRTKDTVTSLVKQLGGVDALRATTGLPLSTYFSAVKLKWLLDNVPAVKQAGDDLRVGTVDAWLTWNLTGGAAGKGNHVTDVTNASRTLLMDINTCQWSSSIVKQLGLPLASLPRIVSSAEPLGTISSSSSTGVAALQGCRITAAIGDQQAAMLGQLCLGLGDTKNTFGTGSFMLTNTGTKAVPSTHGLLTTPCYQLGPKQPVTYALEGSVATAGAAIDWAKRVGFFADVKEMNALAASTRTSGGVHFVPAFSGLLAPYWQDNARGIISGMTLATEKKHVARALLEGMAWQVREVMDSMAADLIPASSSSSTTHHTTLVPPSNASSATLPPLRVDGGVSLSNELLQILSDVTGRVVQRPHNIETTALGAAIAAGVGAGVWSPAATNDVTQVLARQLTGVVGQYTSFSPQIDDGQRDEQLAAWKKAVARSYQ